MITNSFGQVLQKIRIEQGLSQEELDLSRILCKLKPDMPGHPLAEKNRQLI